MASAIQHPRQWIRPTARGLYCVPGDFYVDPASQVARAIITHGHGDHARPGNESVLATAETIANMRTRFGEDAGSTQAIAYGEAIRIGEVMVRLALAGHILGSAQVVLDYGRRRVVISGDYKRRADETCAPFEPVAADVFVTEATFGLPVFRHPDDGGEIAKVLRSLCLFPERAHLVGVYGLGKCQRVLRLLRRAGYDRPVYLHGGARRAVRALRGAWCPARPDAPGHGGGRRRRYYPVSADGAARSLVPPLFESGDGDGFGLDGGAPAGKATRRRAAVADLGPRRLGRTRAHTRGRRRRGGVGDPRA